MMLSVLVIIIIPLVYVLAYLYFDAKYQATQYKGPIHKGKKLLFGFCEKHREYKKPLPHEFADPYIACEVCDAQHKNQTRAVEDSHSYQVNESQETINRLYSDLDRYKVDIALLRALNNQYEKERTALGWIKSQDTRAFQENNKRKVTISDNET